MKYGDLRKELMVTIEELPKSKLDELRHILTTTHKRRFIKIYKRRYKYGTIDTTFTDQEFTHFLSYVYNKKFELLFKFQAYLGLRIGEVVRLMVGDIDFKTRELTFLSEKTNIIDTLIIPQELFNEFISFILKYEYEISKAQGYIFFKDAQANSRNKILHLDRCYAAKVFRMIRKRAGLDQIYGYADGNGNRPLYRLGTHSLRRYSATRFYRSNKNLVLTSRFLRHTNVRETVKYIANLKTELYREIDLAFS